MLKEINPEYSLEGLSVQATREAIELDLEEESRK